MTQNLGSCCFCLLDMNDNQSITSLKCNHIFHTICVRQYNNDTCPLCRGDKIVKEEKFSRSEIKKYDNDEYVWIFGAFHTIPDTNRKNHIVCDLSGKKYSSGYFWRLFGDDISKTLETSYQAFSVDKSKNIAQIEIGSSSYNVLYDGFTLDKDLTAIDKDIQVCIQSNQYRKYRPIIRIKWKDVVNNLLVVGIHDNMFFDHIYVYVDTNAKYYFFNVENQDKINSLYKTKDAKKKKPSIEINGEKYSVDVESDTICKNKKAVYGIEVFEKQNIHGS